MLWDCELEWVGKGLVGERGTVLLGLEQIKSFNQTGRNLDLVDFLICGSVLT